MKIYNKLFIGTSLCLAVCSCTDQGLLPYPGELQVPDELTQNANLQEYDILKNYVNRTENPGFKLGIAVDENDFGGTFLWLGQNYGNQPWIRDEALSYANEAWEEEVTRVSQDPDTGHIFQAGDYVEVYVRNSLFYGGKRNINYKT